MRLQVIDEVQDFVLDSFHIVPLMGNCLGKRVRRCWVAATGQRGTRL